MSETIHNMLLVIGLLILACLLFGLPLMFLWNWIMPDIFGLSQIGFLQACGLQLIAGLLFKSTTQTKTNNE
jgi:hypothetical protein